MTNPTPAARLMNIARDHAIAYDDGTYEFDEDSLARFIDDVLADGGAAPAAQHASDCAVHNMPAYPNGPCNCGAQPPLDATMQGGEREAAILRAGGQLADVAFNLAQRPGSMLPENICKILDTCRKEWDAAIAKGKAPRQPATAEALERPSDCTRDPTSCPDNEGCGCYCSDLALSQRNGSENG